MQIGTFGTIPSKTCHFMQHVPSLMDLKSTTLFYDTPRWITRYMEGRTKTGAFSAMNEACNIPRFSTLSTFVRRSRLTDINIRD